MYKIRPHNEKLYGELIGHGYNKIVSLLLSQRLNTMDEAMRILRPDEVDYNIDELKDSMNAAELILEHINKGSLIVIISDYDSDGCNANAFLFRALTEYFNMPKEKVIQITNERIYKNGVNMEMLKRVLEINSDNHVGLVITVDHGTYDDDRYEIMRQKDIDVITTDHHLLPESGGPKFANVFVNPQRPDCKFNKNISGATVIYFVMKQLYNLHNIYDIKIAKRDDLLSLLPLIALTVISDQMSLQDPLNRVLLRDGLEEANKLEDTIWKTLSSVGEIDFPINEDTFGFNIGPIINAGGRMGNAHLATMFLSETDYGKSKTYLRNLVDLNKSRKDLQSRLLTIANKQVSQFTKSYKHTIVNILPEGHGVGGIVASMVGERYMKPIFVFSDVGDNVLMGSGRAILDQFDIKKALDYVHEKDSTILTKYGGHAGAAGAEMKREDAAKFFALFDEATGVQLKDKGIDDVNYYYDLDLPPKFLTTSILKVISKIGPFGNKWHKPIFSSKFLVKNIMKVGADKRHLVVNLIPELGYSKINAFYPNYDIKKYSLLDSNEANIIYNITVDRGDRVRLLIEDVYKGSV